MFRFFDTNVLVYQFDGRDLRKQAIARHLWTAAVDNGSACISAQVLAELLHVLRRKAAQPLPIARLQALASLYGRWVSVNTSAGLIGEALQLADRHRIGLYDAMIVQAAIDAGAEVLFSEDLHDGQQFGAVKVVNPFDETAPGTQEAEAAYRATRPRRAAGPARRLSPARSRSR